MAMKNGVLLVMKTRLWMLGDTVFVISQKYDSETMYIRVKINVLLAIFSIQKSDIVRRTWNT